MIKRCSASIRAGLGEKKIYYRVRKILVKNQAKENLENPLFWIGH